MHPTNYLGLGLLEKINFQLGLQNPDNQTSHNLCQIKKKGNIDQQFALIITEWYVT